MASLKKAIEEKCKDCIYDDTKNSGLGSWRQQVEACPCTDCPLWPVRPVTVKTRNANRKSKGGDDNIPTQEVA
jgi:hypothetical protein